MSIESNLVFGPIHQNVRHTIVKWVYDGCFGERITLGSVDLLSRCNRSSNTSKTPKWSRHIGNYWSNPLYGIERSMNNGRVCWHLNRRGQHNLQNYLDLEKHCSKRVPNLMSAWFNRGCLALHNRNIMDFSLLWVNYGSINTHQRLID